MTRPTPSLDSRDLFLYWWPVTARIFGAAIALWEIVLSAPPDPGALAFAGGLLVAPIVFDAQRKRNDRKESP